MPGSPEPPVILVVSDGTGRTAERVVRAALLQFPDMDVQVEVFPNVGHPDRLGRLVKKAAERRALIVTTLVGHDMRRACASLAKEHRVTAIDLIGDLLERLGSHLRARPDSVPNRMHTPDDEYYARIDAVNFAVKADDGRDVRLLAKADVVFVGIDGTSKTPLSIYLAHMGYRVANVPVTLGQPLPAQLEQVDAKRIFALTIEPSCLIDLLGRLGPDKLLVRRGGTDPQGVVAEVDWAERLFSQHPEWPVIDVTRKATEETAATVARILADRSIGRAGRPIPTPD